MIEVRGLKFGYRETETLFDDFSFTVGKGESWTIIGPSGCGKTTLLYLMAGLTRPRRGDIMINGQVLKRPRPDTGLVLQDHGLLPWATVLDNTRLGLKIRKYYGPDGKHSPKHSADNEAARSGRIEYWLGRLGIDHLRDMYPAQLSRGQRQRAAIARTLVLEPDLLLMDEPFSALDAPIRIELQKTMHRFHRETRLTSVIVTHDIEEAVVLGEKILVLGNQCNQDPFIIDNELSGSVDERAGSEFKQRCDHLREQLTRCSVRTTDTR